MITGGSLQPTGLNLVNMAGHQTGTRHFDNRGIQYRCDLQQTITLRVNRTEVKDRKKRSWRHKYTHMYTLD